MKRNVILVIGLLLAVLFCPVASAAKEAENYDGFGAAEAQQQMPDAAREYIDPEEDLADQINYQTIWNLISNGTYDVVRGAIVDFGKIMAVVVLFMVLSAFTEGGMRGSTCLLYTSRCV